MPEPRGIAVIGCGDMGSRHARVWHERPDARVIAVYDPLTERAERVTAATGARVCSTMEEAVLADGVQVVSVCTPVVFHADIAVFAARNGRHVLSEKPVALTLEQAESMVAAAREAGVRLAVSYQYRAMARNRRYRDLIRAGTFGNGPLFFRYMDIREVRPKLAMHQQSMNGGPLIDMCGHFFDLVRWFTSEEPVRVYASGHVYGHGKPRLASLNPNDLAIDVAAIEVTYAGGHNLSVFADWGMPEGFAEQGEERIVGPAMAARTIDGGGIACTFGEKRTEEWRPEAPDPFGPLARIADLCAALDEGRAPEVTGEDGIAALRVSLAALESIHTGRSIDLA